MRSKEQNTVFYSYLACFCEYINLEFVRVPVIYRFNQAEYIIHIRVAASQEYVNTYSTRRLMLLEIHPCFSRSKALRVE